MMPTGGLREKKEQDKTHRNKYKDMAVILNSSPDSMIPLNCPLRWCLELDDVGGETTDIHLAYQLVYDDDTEITEIEIAPFAPIGHEHCITFNEEMRGLVFTNFWVNNPAVTRDQDVRKQVKLKYGTATYDTATCTDPVISLASETSSVWIVNAYLPFDRESEFGNDELVLSSRPHTYWQWKGTKDAIWVAGGGTVQWDWWTESSSGTVNGNMSFADGNIVPMRPSDIGLSNDVIRLQVTLSYTGGGSDVYNIYFAETPCIRDIAELHWLEFMGSFSSLGLYIEEMTTQSKSNTYIFGEKYEKDFQTTALDSYTLIGGNEKNHVLSATRKYKLYRIFKSETELAGWLSSIRSGREYYLLVQDNGGNDVNVRFIPDGAATKVFSKDGGFRLEITGDIRMI